MMIYIGSDHAGFEMKEELKKYLSGLGHQVEDKGAFSRDPADDYPDFIFLVAKAVAADKNSRGLVMGKSGQGEAMTANRVKGVRAAVWYGGNAELLKLSREHNDANVLSLAAGFVSIEEAKEAVELWLNTPFSNEERHVRRIKKLDA
ncbi:ribose-5-phosphate isomerase [Candidatus Wolfebacteria bacterium RIFCSPLOWO2_01_FULL_45_19]|uniref:Ribose-5-phosphate isomerase n=1 Tax=Candidatus Wolfebacteria bacterium RIFCSPLOWO2_01_FULL_45_19 TaxID=1802557 RepID=A0A1F8DQS8_9BACT|nr:MAG: Ribose-5-phosphate isomerase B [Parcubacteria group bacterium GW2011_GWB1_45_9]OGM90983.1 MAG: ribose-5-phosphate isomerase [Candidatus Wolfebacteria bacterium RIFCSPLOWO2_01_FULL_45_19]